MFNETNTPRQHLETGDAACILYHCIVSGTLTIVDADRHRGIDIAIEGLTDMEMIEVAKSGDRTIIRPTEKGVARFTRATATEYLMIAFLRLCECGRLHQGQIWQELHRRFKVTWEHVDMLWKKAEELGWIPLGHECSSSLTPAGVKTIIDSQFDAVHKPVYSGGTL